MAVGSEPTSHTAGVPPVIWEPSAEAVERANATRFVRWLESERGLRFGDYGALWRWSVDSLEHFWDAVWHFFDVRAEEPARAVLADRMPGARWFEGAELNYAEHVLRFADDESARDRRTGRGPARERSAGSRCAARSVPWPASCANGSRLPATALRRISRTSRRR